MSDESGSRPAKFAPVPTPDTAHFFEGTAAGELRIQRCRACGRAFFYPRSGCPHCGSIDVAWERASGRARLHTYVISHRAAPGFEDQVPYAIAVVELAEGPRMMTNVVGVANTPEALALDMDLEVDFEPRGGVAVPVFRPARSST
jgi:uncharacterized protein